MAVKIWKDLLWFFLDQEPTFQTHSGSENCIYLTNVTGIGKQQCQKIRPPPKLFFYFVQGNKKKNSFQLLFLRPLVFPIYSWSMNIIVLLAYLWAHFLFILCSYMISYSFMVSNNINMPILLKLLSKFEIFLELQTHIYKYILLGGKTTWNWWH